MKPETTNLQDQQPAETSQPETLECGTIVFPDDEWDKIVPRLIGAKYKLEKAYFDVLCAVDMEIQSKDLSSFTAQKDFFTLVREVSKDVFGTREMKFSAWFKSFLVANYPLGWNLNELKDLITWNEDGLVLPEKPVEPAFDFHPRTRNVQSLSVSGGVIHFVPKERKITVNLRFDLHLKRDVTLLCLQKILGETASRNGYLYAII